MIQINKGEAPAALVGAGLTLTNADKAAFDANPASYMNGSNTFPINTAYKSVIVRETLLARQHNKCCYSEAKFVGDYPQVEHYRPKAGIELADGNWLYPGYYWLTYTWSNLFLSKARINVSYKRNFFPLVNEAIRNRTHHDGFIEENVIIDPGAEDPRDHINFHLEEPVGLTGKGHRTIQILGLRHADFEEGRRTKLGVLRGFKDAVDLAIASGIGANDPLVVGMLAVLRAATQPDAEFSSMAIDFLSGWPHLA
jgi:hypothetical protein